MFTKLKFDSIRSMRDFFYNSDNEPNPDAYDFIIRAVTYGVDINADDVIFASAKVEDESVEFAIHKQDFPKTLKYALAHYEEMERYEECSTVKKLLETINTE